MTKLLTWCVSLGAVLPACSRSGDAYFTTTVDYDGVRYASTLAFPATSDTPVAPGAPVIEQGMELDGDVPLAAASSVFEELTQYPPTYQMSYQLSLRRNAQDDAAFAGADPPAPYALCTVYELGQPTICVETIENCSATMVAREATSP